MKIINTPINRDDITGFNTGDIVYLSGTIATGRDDVHRRIVQYGFESPFDFRGMAIFHAGPIVRERPDIEYETVSVGPTSSVRMEEWASGFIEKTGVRIMIGKGGMGGKTASACREHGAIHCVYPGGCAVLGARQVEKIDGVYWRELGMPECLWVMKVREFGPLIVSIDTKGNNMFEENVALYAQRMDACMRPALESLRGHSNNGSCKP